MNPRVKTVHANEDFTLRIRFTKGETRAFDMKPYLDHGIFSELKDLSCFKAVGVVMDTVQWPRGQDVCPDTLYEGGAPRDEACDPVAFPSTR